jgi:hypothetical protein
MIWTSGFFCIVDNPPAFGHGFPRIITIYQNKSPAVKSVGSQFFSKISSGL